MQQTLLIRSISTVGSVIPHGRQLADLANPANNEAFGKVTLADEIDIRKRRCCCKGGVQSVFASDRLI
jgi:hypothetical protein